MIIRIAIFLCLLPFFAVSAAEPPSPTEQARDLVGAVNAVRLVERRPLLRLNPKLTAVAKAHAADMAARGYFGHSSPAGDDLPGRLRQVGYRFALALSNIAVGQRDAHLVVADWLDSKGNRANLLDRNVRDIGAAHLYDSSDPATPRHRHYWVIVLGLADSGKQQEQANAKR